MNSTTATTTKFNKMVLDFKKAKFLANENRLGSAKQLRGEAWMERLVAQAEAAGFLTEFCRAVTA